MSPTGFAARAETPQFNVLTAVSMTLARDPNILIQRQILRSNYGALQAARGPFDLTITSSLQDGIAANPYTQAALATATDRKSLTRTTTVQNNFSQVHRNGTTYSLNTSMTRSENLTLGTSVHALPTNYSTVAFVVNQPLLQGKGREVGNGATELAADLEYQASQLDLHNTLAQRVLTAVQAYWSYVSAIANYQNSIESVKRNQEAINQTRKLIAGGEVAAAEINQYLAQWEGQMSSLRSNEQNLISTRNTLASTIGLTPAELSLIPDTVVGFDDLALPDTSQIIATRFIALALKQRPDYLAYQLREKEAKIRLNSAENGLLPQLNAQVSVGYTGLTEGSRFIQTYQSLGDNIYGSNVTGQLSLSWPVANNAATGAFIQNKAAYDQAVLNTQNTARTIALTLATDLAAINNNVLQLQNAEQAAQYYEISLRNEKKKFTMGNSTAINVVTAETNFTNALTNVITAQLQLANAIAQLRYDCGTLVGFGKESGMVNLANIVTVP